MNGPQHGNSGGDPLSRHLAVWGMNVGRVNEMIPELDAMVKDLMTVDVWYGWVKLDDGYGAPSLGQKPDAKILVTFPTPAVDPRCLRVDGDEISKGTYVDHVNSDFFDIAYHIQPEESLDDVKARIKADLEKLLADAAEQLKSGSGSDTLSINALAGVQGEPTPPVSKAMALIEDPTSPHRGIFAIVEKAVEDFGAGTLHGAQMYRDNLNDFIKASPEERGSAMGIGKTFFPDTDDWFDSDAWTEALMALDRAMEEDDWCVMKEDPDPQKGSLKTLRLGDHVCTIEQDENAEDPRSDDNLGTMACWSRRNRFGDEQPSTDPMAFKLSKIPGGEELGERIDKRVAAFWELHPGWEANLDKAGREERDNMVAENVAEVDAAFNNAFISLPVFMYEHSGVALATEPFGDIFDSGQLGLIYVSVADVRKEFGCEVITDEIREQVLENLRGEVATYGQYLEGEVYGYTIKDSAHNQVDSCWGFFGMESVQQQAESALTGVHEQALQDRAEKAKLGRENSQRNSTISESKADHLGAALDDLIGEGLTILQCRQAFAKCRTPTERAYAEAARGISAEGELVVDDFAEVTLGDGGAYVGVWHWLDESVLHDASDDT